MKTNIIITLRHEALHHWPGCDIEEVMFLKDPHRHIFHIECKKEVKHTDRDIEIIKLKREIELHLTRTFGKDFNHWSCEMIAMHLTKTFKLNYCKVLEDGENGAEVIN